MTNDNQDKPITRELLLKNPPTNSINRPRKWTAFDDSNFNVDHTRVDRFKLTCPICDAVGTYCAHGGDGDAKRYLCKWCGYYRGAGNTNPDAMYEGQCFPNSAAGAWSGPGEGAEPTPMQRIWPLWPWRHG